MRHDWRFDRTLCNSHMYIELQKQIIDSGERQSGGMCGGVLRRACHARSIKISYYDTRIDEAAMTVVTVSPKFQVVIPRDIREAMGLEPGQKVQALQYQHRIEFIPVRSMRSMRGFLEGIDTTVPRDEDRV